MRDQSATPPNGWRLASYLLLAVWVGAAVLGVNGIRAGAFTSYGADLTQPAWLYIIVRGLDNPARKSWITRTFGTRAETTALLIFFVGACTELSQRYWPHGIFRGRFDPWDIVAFGLGILICYLCEKRFPPRAKKLEVAA